jgi:hypothetical protein
VKSALDLRRMLAGVMKKLPYRGVVLVVAVNQVVCIPRVRSAGSSRGVTQLAVVVASMAVCRSSRAEPLRLDLAVLGQGAATPCREMRGSMLIRKSCSVHAVNLPGKSAPPSRLSKCRTSTTARPAPSNAEEPASA